MGDGAIECEGQNEPEIECGRGGQQYYQSPLVTVCSSVDLPGMEGGSGQKQPSLESDENVLSESVCKSDFVKSIAKKVHRKKEYVKKKIWTKNSRGLFAWKYRNVLKITSNPSEDPQRLEQEPPSASAENETNAPAIVQNMEKLQIPIKPGSSSTKKNILSENRAGEERESLKRMKFT